MTKQKHLSHNQLKVSYSLLFSTADERIFTMKFSSLAAIAAVLISNAVVNSQDSTLCASETLAIQNNVAYAAAVAAYNVAAANQTKTCIDNMQTSCDLNLDSQKTDVENACINAAGMLYEPSLSVSCDNDNTKVTTTWITNYAMCIGTNCTNTAELETEVNGLLDNQTAQVNQILNPLGINCGADFSGAIPSSHGMAAAFGSMIAAAALFLTF
jgi:hypothetical protein